MKKQLCVIGLAMLVASCAPEPGANQVDEAGAADYSNASAAAPPDPESNRSRDNVMSPQAETGGRVSRYTSLGDCRVTDSKPDEGGYKSSVCAGPGGYVLRLIDADARQNPFVRTPARPEQSLKLSEIAGSGFSRIGDQIEWRGMMTRGKFQPDALMLRYSIIESEGKAETEYLLPVALGTTGPCVAARIAPGPDQSIRAGATVDGPMDCLRS